MASADDVRKGGDPRKKEGDEALLSAVEKTKKQRNRRAGYKKGMTVLQLRCIVDCSFVRAWGLKPVTGLTGWSSPKRAGLSRLGTNQAADS